MSDEEMGITPEDRVGTTMGDYVVGSIVGRGGVGVVYSAVDPEGTRVALKVVKPEIAADETFTRRFQREARIGQTVRHPCVVPVLQIGEHNGIPYLAQQFIEGGSLEDLLAREELLDVETTVRICSQVAEGLQALWAAGMVHRDVKPGNILLDLEGNAYITDFGFAKDDKATILTAAGQALGSMDYMAPEQIRGDGVTAATDVYALGCVVFECLEGRPPFAHRKGVQVLWAHLQDEPPNLRARDEVDPTFAQEVHSALRKEPADRPQSTTEYVRRVAEAGRVPPA